MDQQINLYLPEFRIRKDPLTAVLMGQIVAGVVAVLFLLSAFDFYSGWRLQSELQEQRAVLREETRRTEELDDQLALRTQNQGLQERLAQAEAELEASRQISQFLSRTQLGNVTGFSQHFKDLARASVDGISISSFNIASGGSSMQLAGEVIDSNLVPRYVVNLGGGESTLKQLRFSPSIARTDAVDQAFSFTLSSGGGNE